MKLIILGFITIVLSCKNKTEKTEEKASQIAEEIHKTEKTDSITVIPIEHATMILKSQDLVLYVDPVGGKNQFANQAKPDFVLITDLHGDHLDVATLQSLELGNSILIVPKAVADLLPTKLKVKELIILNNGETKEFDNLKIEAFPMYNLRKEALKFHKKGRGNGYILTLGNQKVYISGDTEDIPEMRALQDIDMAFVCMNLPYTMTVESAASAVLDFKPKKVYPYHYQGTEGLSDVHKFKSLLNEKNPEIEVIQLNWYH